MNKSGGKKYFGSSNSGGAEFNVNSKMELAKNTNPKG
jgi:hypothetical protein